MLTFRRSQLEALEQGIFDRYVKRLCETLRQDHPEETGAQTDAALGDFVAEGLRRAQEYGLSAGRDLKAFVALRLVIDADFDADPVIAEILGSRELPPGEKIDHVFDALGEREDGSTREQEPADEVG